MAQFKPLPTLSPEERQLAILVTFYEKAAAVNPDMAKTEAEVAAILEKRRATAKPAWFDKLCSQLSNKYPGLGHPIHTWDAECKQPAAAAATAPAEAAEVLGEDSLREVLRRKLGREATEAEFVEQLATMKAHLAGQMEALPTATLLQ